MKIVVTGCCGFIGSHLCEFLLKNTENTILGVDIMNDYNCYLINLIILICNNY